MASGLPAASLAAALSEIERAQSLSTVLHTPCGDGAVVWHAWGEGRPLLLLHGGSGSWTHWIRNIEFFASHGFKVIVPDLPGSGDSAAPPDGHDADVIPRWLAPGLARWVGDHGAIDVVGFSFGSLVSVLLAHEYPEYVARLILVGPPILPSQTSAQVIGLRSWRDQPPGTLRDAVHQHNLRAFMLARPESADALAVKVHGDNIERDRLTKRRLSRTSLMHDTMLELRQPIDVIVGELDVLYRNQEELLARTVRALPTVRSYHPISRTGHWVPYESAERFNQLVLELLQ